MEPVKLNFWKRPLSMASIMAWPAPLAPPPWTMLTTPSGSPASCMARKKRSAMTGASSEGFHTTVLPARIAGRIFQLGTAMGKLPAVIMPTTPMGRR